MVSTQFTPMSSTTVNSTPYDSIIVELQAPAVLKFQLRNLVAVLFAHPSSSPYIANVVSRYADFLIEESKVMHVHSCLAQSSTPPRSESEPTPGPTQLLETWFAPIVSIGLPLFCDGQRTHATPVLSSI